jgi:hypothetical protein
MGGSLENHYQCYLKMAVRRSVAILILGADCCDTVSGSVLPFPIGFGGLVVSMLASCTQDRGFTAGRDRRIFSGEKILSMLRILSRRFAAWQRTL